MSYKTTTDSRQWNELLNLLRVKKLYTFNGDLKELSTDDLEYFKYK